MRPLKPTRLEGALDDVDEALEALREGRAARIGKRDPWWSAEEVRSLVEELTAVRDSSAAALELAVAEARRKGLSWAIVGRALGLSRQGAEQRYGRRS